MRVSEVPGDPHAMRCAGRVRGRPDVDLQQCMAVAAQRTDPAELARDGLGTRLGS